MFLRFVPFLTLVVAGAAVLVDCNSAPPSPTAVPTNPAAATPANAPTSAPPATKAASPTAAPIAAKPAPTAATTGNALSDFASKAKGIKEYSVDVNITFAGQSLATKMYYKDLKVRQELTAGPQKVVTLLDLDKKVAYTLLVDQKSAIKTDFSQTLSQTTVPNFGAQDSDAKQVGTDILDGKAATVFEVADPQVPRKIWIWNERGMPLKIESTTGGIKAVEFTNYQFGSLPDSLFSLPEGTQIR